MAHDDTFARPAFGKVLLSFAVGMVLGVACVLPTIRDDLTLLELGGTGPVGDVLVLGVLSMAVVTTGLFGLYRLFWLIDR